MRGFMFVILFMVICILVVGINISEIWFCIVIVGEEIGSFVWLCFINVFWDGFKSFGIRIGKDCGGCFWVFWNGIFWFSFYCISMN